MSLVAHPAPESGESPAGYLLRLADINGYFDLAELIDESSNLGKYRLDSCMDSLSELAAELGSVKHFELLSPKSVPHNATQVNLLPYGPVLIKSPRICAMCMSEGANIKAEWHVMQITHCEKHHTQLLESCTCGAKFVWDEMLLSYGCSKCGKSWLEFEGAEQELPRFMQTFFALEIQQRANFINDITSAALTRARPYDTIVDSHHLKPKHVANWLGLLKSGYELITDPETFEQWLSSCAFVRSEFKALGNRAVFYPFYRLVSQLQGDWLIKNKQPTVFNTAPSSSILPSKVRSLNNKRNIMVERLSDEAKDEGYIYHINRESLAYMLEVDLIIARELFTLDCLSSFTNEKLIRNNTSCIKPLLKHALESAESSLNSATSLSKLTEFGKGFGATTADVLVAIFKGYINCSINLFEQQFLDCINVDKVQLSEYLSGPFMLDESRIFSLTQVTRILGLPRNIVAKIAKKSVIEEVSSPTNKHNYTAISISEFLDQYIVVLVWAEIHDCCDTKVIKVLRLKEIYPSYGHNVFEKTRYLLDVLESIKSEGSWKASEQLALL